MSPSAPTQCIPQTVFYLPALVPLLYYNYFAGAPQTAFYLQVQNLVLLLLTSYGAFSILVIGRPISFYFAGASSPSNMFLILDTESLSTKWAVPPSTIMFCSTATISMGLCFTAPLSASLAKTIPNFYIGYHHYQVGLEQLQQPIVGFNASVAGLTSSMACKYIVKCLYDKGLFCILSFWYCIRWGGRMLRGSLVHVFTICLAGIF